MSSLVDKIHYHKKDGKKYQAKKAKGFRVYGDNFSKFLGYLYSDHVFLPEDFRNLSTHFGHMRNPFHDSTFTSEVFAKAVLLSDTIDADLFRKDILEGPVTKLCFRSSGLFEGYLHDTYIEFDQSKTHDDERVSYDTGKGLLPYPFQDKADPEKCSISKGTGNAYDETDKNPSTFDDVLDILKESPVSVYPRLYTYYEHCNEMDIDEKSWNMLKGIPFHNEELVCLENGRRIRKIYDDHTIETRGYVDDWRSLYVPEKWMPLMRTKYPDALRIEVIFDDYHLEICVITSKNDYKLEYGYYICDELIIYKTIPVSFYTTSETKHDWLYKKDSLTNFKKYMKKINLLFC